MEKIVDVIDVEARHLKMVHSVLARYLPHKVVWAYGSRVKWNATERSDLDCVVFDATDTELYNAREAFDESDIPFKVQILSWDSIPSDFKDNISNKYFVLQTETSWRECRLGDAPLEILDGDRGKNYPSQGEFSSNGYCLFLSTKNVRFDGFDFSDCQFISKERDELLRKGKLQRNDIVLTTRGTIGNIGFFDSSVSFDRIRINSGMVIIRPNEEELSPKFNYYIFRNLQKDFHVFTSGSAQPQLPIRDLNKIEILLPTLPEQKTIAEVLSSLDDKIDLLHRQNNTLEALAETLFRHYFIDNADDDWETVSIVDVAQTNISTVKGDYPHQEILYLDTGSITEGKIEALQPYELKDAPSRAKRLVQHNDIIISTVRPNHKHYGFVNNPADNLVVSTGFCVVSCTKIDPNFIYSLLTQKDMTEYLSVLAEASTSTYPSLKPSDIKAIEFQMPPHDLLEKFADVASENWKKIASNYKQIQTLEKLRDTLLPKLISGDIRLQYKEKK